MDLFRKNILDFNRQLTASAVRLLNSRHLARAKYGGVVIVGMGGSGLAGDILTMARRDIGLRLPVVMWKNYELPATDFRNPLHIFVSFSGNTEETLSGFKTLLKSRGSPKRFAAVTAGGELERLSRRFNVPLAHFDAGTLTPRQSVGIMFYSLVKILKSAGAPLKVSENTSLKPRLYEDEGESLARRLWGKVITIYTDETRKAIGYIWKIKFNETAKTLAFSNILPEADHNEIVGFRKPKIPRAALFLEDTSLLPRLKKRFSFTKKVIKKQGVATYTVPLQGRNLLEKAWRSLVLADWTTYSLAKISHLDPLETEVIDTLKKLMK